MDRGWPYQSKARTPFTFARVSVDLQKATRRDNGRWQFESAVCNIVTSQSNLRGETRMASPLYDLTDKVAIITGSTKGIGRAIAEELARAGAKVVISSRKAEKCEEVAAAIRSEGLEASAIPCHIGKREDVENLISETRNRYGKIDILVCNAALNPYYG